MAESDPNHRVRELLQAARAAEPAQRLSDRTAALDQAEDLLAVQDDEGESRALRLEVTAERAIDAVRLNQLDAAHELADRVLDTPGFDGIAAFAAARALEARARAWAWSGTDRGAVRGDRLFAEVADRYAGLGDTERRGFVRFWQGFQVQSNFSDFRRANELVILGPLSAWRATVLSFYADLLVTMGQFADAESAIAEGIALADEGDDVKTRGYMQWTAAKLSSARGDRLASERHLREVEREGGEWLATHGGVSFFADAAELLDRVGLEGPAASYLERAVHADPKDETCCQAVATVTARSGDPVEGMRALQELMAGEWFDKGLLWRHTALQAWATFRMGDRSAGALAARAFELAEQGCGVVAAVANERELMTALAPLAEQSGAGPGSDLARSSLGADVGPAIVVRMIGGVAVRRLDGRVVDLPSGRPAELVGFLAVRPAGASVEKVVDALFPDAALDSGRNRLRQLLHRIRAVDADLVVREGDRLRLAPAWVDVTAFIEAADRASASTGVLAVRRAHAALAVLAGPGSLPGATTTELPFPDASWAAEVGEAVEYRRLAVLDIVAREATGRGSRREAVAALRAAVDREPDSTDRRAQLAAELFRLGQTSAAAHLMRPLVGEDR